MINISDPVINSFSGVLVDKFINLILNPFIIMNFSRCTSENILKTQK